MTPAVSTETKRADRRMRVDRFSAGTETNNAAIAERFREYANLLEHQGSDGFRSRAYRRAADVIASLDRSLSDILAEEGRAGLIAIQTIGEGIASAIEELVVTGRWSQIERLRGEAAPEELFKCIPGIGPELAHRLAEDAHLETLEDLEHALLLGELPVKGLGPRRREMIRLALAERLGRWRAARSKKPTILPSVKLLLKVDSMYREKAQRGELRRIAPKRFNPHREAWLPVMHARHNDWHFTALYSNTWLAHQFGKTHDWVVIYFQKDGQAEGRCTVVTESRGPRKGRRVVRGREQKTDAGPAE